MKEYQDYQHIIQKLRDTKTITREDCKTLLLCEDKDVMLLLQKQAQDVAQEHFSNGIYIRGLIEFSNYCKNDCFYCGIRKSQTGFHRYRLEEEDILDCCKQGYAAGLRTFVLQGGEDPYYQGKRLANIISKIHEQYPDCAITISDGEHPIEEYKAYKEAGANRFLLRHETIDEKQYASLHPSDMSLKNRVRCLYDLKSLGFQTGSGIMVGTPNQSIDSIVDDVFFLQDLQPEMIGIGPFLPSVGTPFEHEKPGDVLLTLRLLAILRLLHPNALIPSTTALASSSGDGRLQGILFGANVVMPNLSPIKKREMYHLYDNKIASGAEAVETLQKLQDQLESIGYTISYDRGDFTYRKEHYV